MKSKALTRKMLSALLALTCVFSMIPSAHIHAAAAEHVHDAECGYSAPTPCSHTTHDETCGFAEASEAADCTHVHGGDCSYAEAVEGANCTHEHVGCGYEAAVPATPCTHVCSAETGCTDGCVHDFTYHDGYCGYFEGSPESPCEHSHDGTCGYVEAVAGVECDHEHDTNCGYAEAVDAQPCTHEHDAACGYSEGSDCNYVPPATHTHSYSTATCSTPATCSCGATTGSVDSTNHTGGTEVRNASSATATQSGYTGDTYCRGCGRLLAMGTTIPATGDFEDYDPDPVPVVDELLSEDGELTVMMLLGLEPAGGSTAHDTLSRAEAATLIYRAVQEGADQIVLDYSDKVVGNVSSAEITIPSTVIAQISEGTDAGLQIKTPFADAAIDPDTLAKNAGELLMDARRTGNAISTKVTIGGEAVIDAGVTLPEGVEMTDDMKLIVSTEKATLAPIASTVVEKTSLGDLQCPEEYDTLTDGDAVLVDEIKCKLYETLVIGGAEYLLLGSSQDGAVSIRFPDGRGVVYSEETGVITDYPDSSFDRTVEKPANTTVTIDGVTYDVAYVMNNSTYILYRDGQLAGMYPSTDDAADLHGSVQFYEGYDPETLKAQQDDNDLGSVTIPADYNNAAIADFAPGKTYKVSVVAANDISVEGYDDALLNSIKVETEAEKAAKAEVERLKADMDAKRAALDQLGMYDPNHMEDWAVWHEAERAFEEALAALTGNQQATVTQTFKIPDALVAAKNVQYVAVHDTNPYAAELAEAEQAATYNDEFDRQAGDHYAEVKARYDAWEEENGSSAEFGFPSEEIVFIEGADGKLEPTMVWIYSVKDFSPFIVYAFVEQPEPEYKELSATLHTEHTGGTATCKDKAVCEICGEIYGELAAHTYENGTCTVCGEADQTVDDKKTLVYTVVKGDTLWALSKKYGCTVAELVALNSSLIKDPDLILIGWELAIPEE